MGFSKTVFPQYRAISTEPSLSGMIQVLDSICNYAVDWLGICRSVACSVTLPCCQFRMRL